MLRSFNEARDLYQENKQEVAAIQTELLETLRRRQEDETKDKDILNANISRAMIQTLAQTICGLAKSEEHAKVLYVTAISALMSDIRAHYLLAGAKTEGRA